MIAGTCIRIGYGAVAGIHERALLAVGIRAEGILELSPERRELAAQAGHHLVPSYAAALALRPTFWDICVDTRNHAEVLENILALDPAANILIEKPVCSPSDIQRVLRVAAQAPRARIVVNENYRSSSIITAVRRIAFEEQRLLPRRIAVEMTKDRSSDFEAGRFIDEELEALGYEGPHMVAVLQMLGLRYRPFKFVHASLEDLALDAAGGARVLPRQGCGHVHYVTQDGVHVDLWTSLAGTVKTPHPMHHPAGKAEPPPIGARHRLVVVEGTRADGREVMVMGLFEPVSGLPRPEGAVLTVEDGEIRSHFTLQDDTMAEHMRRAVRHFLGDGQNPADVGSSIEAVELLQEARAFAASSNHAVASPRNASASTAKCPPCDARAAARSSSPRRHASPLDATK